MLICLYEHIHLTPGTSDTYCHECQGSCASVKVHTIVSKVLSNCLNYLQAQLEQPYFV